MERQSPTQRHCLLQIYRIVWKLYGGCPSATYDHIIVYFRQFDQNIVPVDARSNTIFIHSLASVVGIKDMFHELIRTITKSYQVVDTQLFQYLTVKELSWASVAHFDLFYCEVFSLHLKLTFRKYPAIHTNYIIFLCTTLQYNDNI